MTQSADRIVRIDLDGASMGPGDVNADHERRVAIADLLEGNRFRPDGDVDGPFALRLAIEHDRLVFDVRQEDDTPVRGFMFALGPLRRIVKDYFLICESYYEAVRDAPLERIEAIDMARRGVHNEGSTLLRERLVGKIDVDFDTARRLFTLICALHRRATS
ncbi:UPF0262 family protein [Maricaulis maris]|uniref:UPF0262 protein C7435_2743 n=1 Tax=Maricaulis maris TaxID=74318 RepID=A0A495D4C5_9PROT|nr:UPF0262 family protein [Maricaulis maris]RKQ95639.1 uncharacterized protein (UPF0262 family) [Maricaulis maris]